MTSASSADVVESSTSARTVLFAGVRLASRYGIVVLLALLILIGALTQDRFLTSNNLIGIISQSAPLGLVAIGMTFVLIAGGFDLSVAAIVAVGSIAFARLAPEMDVLPALLCAVAAGLLCGLINGLVVTILKVNAFVATFGTSSIFVGLTLLYTGGMPFYVTGDAFKFLGSGQLGPLPFSIWVLIATFLIAGFVLAKTTYGRMLYAVGGNEEASKLSGIRVEPVRASAFVLLGGLAAFAGAMYASRLSVGQAEMAPMIALDAIAVVVIGGTSLAGGEGAMWRTLAGLLLLGVLNNLFFGWAVDPNWQQISKGLIVIAAVSLDYFGRKLA